MSKPPREKKPAEREFKRLNRTTGVGELVGRVIDPALRKRGFASRDIITHWRAMAPPPFDTVTAPDKLTWPRGERSAEGAVLHLRCAPGHNMAVEYEAARIAAAVNRYFGYLLVGKVRLSLEPLAVPALKAPPVPAASADARKEVTALLQNVEDDGLRDTLRRLGHAILGRAGR